MKSGGNVDECLTYKRLVITALILQKEMDTAVLILLTRPHAHLIRNGTMSLSRSSACVGVCSLLSTQTHRHHHKCSGLHENDLHVNFRSYIWIDTYPAFCVYIYCIHKLQLHVFDAVTELMYDRRNIIQNLAQIPVVLSAEGSWRG